MTHQKFQTNNLDVNHQTRLETLSSDLLETQNLLIVNADDGTNELSNDNVNISVQSSYSNDALGSSRIGQGLDPVEDVNNEVFDVDDFGDEIDWEHLFGLDGSFNFIEHVLWLIAFNTLFIVLFGNYYLLIDLFYFFYIKFIWFY